MADAEAAEDSEATLLAALRDVHVGLNPPPGVRLEVQYDTAVTACSGSASPLFAHLEEVRDFVNQDLLRVVELFLQQDPFDLPAKHHANIETIVESALRIFLALPDEEQSKHLNILDAVFTHEPKAKYYNAVRKLYNEYGKTQVRTLAAQSFAEGKGYEVMLRILEEDRPVSFELLLNIFRCLESVHNFVSSETRMALSEVMFKRLMAESEDQLKKERALEGLPRFIYNIGRMSREGGYQRFYLFWLNFTAKLMSSGFLVLRLFAWDQVNELIREALHRRPLAQSYRIENSSTLFVNGLYRLIKGWPCGASYDPDCGLYEREPLNEDEPRLTLFRCTMQNQLRYWFISKADPQHPGGKKDLDYYLNNSQSHIGEYIREPPQFGWVKSAANTDPGDSPPTLTRIASETEREEKTLFQQLAELAVKNNLLDHAYGSSSIKTELVTRSLRLLRLLVECNVLTGEHLRWIWKSAIQNQDGIITESVFGVLSNLSSILSDELFGELVNAALDTLSQDSTAPSLVKVSLFLEKLTTEQDGMLVSCISEVSSDKLLSLVWFIHQSPHFETLKNGHVAHKLLTKCLSRNSDGRMSMLRVNECLATLNEHAMASSPGVTAKYDEAALGRVIQTLQFLTSNQTGFAVTDTAVQNHFPSSIYSELNRFTISNRPRVANGKVDRTWYSLQLANRLQLLRQFYGVSPFVKIPLDFVDSLWSMLSKHPAELDVILEFFMKGVEEHQGGLDCIFTDPDCVTIFGKYLCSQSIDWTTCSCTSFDCFNSFFTLESRSFNRFSSLFEKLRDSGVETLWRIAMSIASPEATTKATQLLLKYYDEAILDDTSSGKMLEIAFAHLEDCLASLSAGTGSTSDSAYRKTRVSRCVDLLTSAISDTGSLLLSHAICGTMSRFFVTVQHRKVKQFSHSGGSGTYNYTPTVERSEGTVILDLHPLMTVSQLKEKLRKEVSFPDTTNIVLDNSAKTLMSAPSWSRLQELGLTEGSEIEAAYVVKSQYYNTSPNNRSLDDLLPSALFNVGEAISRDDSQFRCLLNLCEKVDDAEIRKKIWTLLMIVPTHEGFVSDIKNAFDDYSHASDAETKRIDWGALLGSSVSQMTYILQVADQLMQPSQEMAEVDEYSMKARLVFLQSGGVSHVIDILNTIPLARDEIKRTALSTGLHILHYFLVAAVENLVPREHVYGPLERSSLTIVDKLLAVASDAAEMQTPDVVQEAFQVLRLLLLKSPSATSQLIANPHSKKLLAICLRSASQNVRKISSDFAIFVGESQSVVFQWLLAEIEHVEANDLLCADTFRALCELLLRLSKVPGAIEIDTLASVLSRKILEFTAVSNRSAVESSGSESQVLLGYLTLLKVVVDEHFDAISSTDLGPVLVRIFLDDFLFSLPSNTNNFLPICTSKAVRTTAFGVILAFVGHSTQEFVELNEKLAVLVENGAKLIYKNWNQQVSHDVKKPSVKFSGLKNQGCTCYMNSLLQQLYLCTGFRDAVLSAPLRFEHRGSISHFTDEELVGKILSVDSNKTKLQIRVDAFHPDKAMHTVSIQNGVDAYSKQETLNLHQAAVKSMRVVHSNVPEEIANPPEAGAMAVFEQLQRTFYYMQFSNKRFYDPVNLVEACKTLPLEYSVYQQNDAAEFLTLLLDRVEIATKGKYTFKNVWSNIFEKKFFGLKAAFHKIPKSCDVYHTSKPDCGMTQSIVPDVLPVVALDISGKDTLEESLAKYFEPEYMEGDNAINCETCKEKKDTTRVAAIVEMPNILIMHFKRFSLDYDTFEPMKLNGRMEFPPRINMLNYSKEGIEWEERKQAAAAAAAAAATDADDDDASVSRDGGSPPVSPTRRSSGKLRYEGENEDSDGPDPEDYEYELQGVLVHSGIAGGGHYYSFARDPDDKERWYRLDDEDVSPFNPDNIGFHCFGGPASMSSSPSGSYTSASDSEDRTANALLLFYSKVKPINVSVSPSYRHIPELNQDPASDGVRLMDGYEAFREEVRRSNLQHTMLKYLFDQGMHSFVRNLLVQLLLVSAPAATVSASSSPQPQQASEEAREMLQVAAQFSSKFFVDVVLHSRERTKKDCRTWVQVLRRAFDRCPAAAYCLLTDDAFLEKERMYLQNCPDAQAKKSFNDLRVAALSALVSAAHTGAFDQVRVDELVEHTVRGVTDALPRCAFDVKNLDEVVQMIRDLARVPVLRAMLLKGEFIPQLAYFLEPGSAESGVVRSHFDVWRNENIPHCNQWCGRQDFMFAAGSLYEAIASLLGAQHIRKIALYADPPKQTLSNSSSYATSFDLTTEFADDTKEAFAAIFGECSSAVSANGSAVMSREDVAAYIARVGYKEQAADNLLSCLAADGSLSLEAFLSYQTDRREQKLLWVDLRAFGFRNDLTRENVDEQAIAEAAAAAAAEAEIVARLRLEPSEQSCRSISNFSIYDYGITCHDPSALEMAKFVCTMNESVSYKFISKLLEKLSRTVSADAGYSMNSMQNMYIQCLAQLCGIDDELRSDRVEHALLLDNVGLASVVISQLTNPTQASRNYASQTIRQRYLSFVDKFRRNPAVEPVFLELAADPEQREIRIVKRMLRVSTEHELSEEEMDCVRSAVLELSGSGLPEVDGVYTFHGIKRNAGHYLREGTWQGRPMWFSVYRYKVSSHTGGDDSQWFVTATPPGADVGGKDDIDLYYGIVGRDPLQLEGRILPPSKFSSDPNYPSTRDPPPMVKLRYDPVDSVEIALAARARSQAHAQAQAQAQAQGHTLHMHGGNGMSPDTDSDDAEAEFSEDISN